MFEDFKIDVIPMKRHKIDVNSIHGAIIKIEHIPSGIIVTKYHKKTQVKAKEEALEELKILVAHWERKEVE